jgi:hypothetical protein
MYYLCSRLPRRACGFKNWDIHGNHPGPIALQLAHGQLNLGLLLVSDLRSFVTGRRACRCCVWRTELSNEPGAAFVG